jgi:hypothetical protein
MEAQVPRHLNKKPLIAGLEPIELLAVAALLIGANILCKSIEVSGIWAGVVAVSIFGFLKFYKRGKAPGHFLHLLRFHLREQSVGGFPNGKR